MASDEPRDQPDPFSEPILGPLASERLAGVLHAAVVVWLVIGLVLLGVFGMWLLYQVRQIFPPLFLALFMIFLLNPIVTRLERRGIRRGFGTLAIYLAFIVIVFLIGLAVTPALREQVAELGEQGPELVEGATRTVERVASALGVDFQSELLRERLDEIQAGLFTGFDQVTRFATGAFHVVLIFVLAPFIALYLLVDLPRLQKSFVSQLPPRYKDEWLALMRRCGEALGGFFRGQLLVAAIVGVLSSIALRIVGIPFWLPIGLLAGFFNIIPLIGPFIGGAVAVAVGAVSGGLVQALLAALAMFIVQQIDNHLISPNVIGRTLRLHPVTIILALLAGGTVAGLWGMLLAVPGTAVTKILVIHYYQTHILGAESLEDKGGEESSADAEPSTHEIAVDEAEAEEEVEAEPVPVTVSADAAVRSATGTPNRTGRRGASQRRLGKRTR